MPRWFVLLLLGTAIGVGGVVFVQERYLPPRLSAQASAKLSSAFGQAQADRARLQRELGETAQRLASTLADKQGLTDELAASRAATEQLRAEVSAVVASLPADPRGGAVEVRAARFSAKNGMLAYDVVLTRERGGSKPMAAVLQLVLAGEPARGGGMAVSLKPVAVTIDRHQVLHGSQPLPEGFRPRQATVQVLDRTGGKLLGMRVLPIR